MLQRDLYQWMTTDPIVSALFPGGIHHMSLPQSVTTWPAMYYSLVTKNEVGEDMESPYDAKLDLEMFQFDVIADSSKETIDAANTFLGILRNYRGTMLASRIQWVSLSSMTHLEERRGDKVRRRVSMDFSITVDVME